MGKKNNYDFKYGIKDVPWPVWVCIAVFIICLLFIIFSTPLKFDIVAAICSIASLFLAMLVEGIDYTNRRVAKIIRSEFEGMAKHFEVSSHEHHKMIEALEKIPDRLDKMAETIVVIQLVLGFILCN